MFGGCGSGRASSGGAGPMSLGALVVWSAVVSGISARSLEKGAGTGGPGQSVDLVGLSGFGSVPPRLIKKIFAKEYLGAPA